MHFNKTVQKKKSLGFKQKVKVLKHSKCLATEQNKCETVVRRTDTERDNNMSTGVSASAQECYRH